MDWPDHLAQLHFFVKSPVLLGRGVLPAMRAERFGRIVHIDSEVADLPPPGRSAYATAKTAQIGLSRSWASELTPCGVTVNTVAPGFMPVERHADVPAAVTNAYLASVPAGRMGTPEDIAHVVGFLASDGAGFVTGQRIVVDGGQHRDQRGDDALHRLGPPYQRGRRARPAGGGTPAEHLLGASRARLLSTWRAPATTTVLARQFGVTPSAISQHLRFLHRGGLLNRQRSGRAVLYLTSELGLACSPHPLLAARRCSR